MDINIYYVYLDKTNDGKVFYVGKGSDHRLRVKKRNFLWQKIAKKYGWSINNREVILATKFNDYACQIEIEFIKKYNTYNRVVDENYIGANLTTGGEGTSGHISGMYGKTHTKIAKDKISKSKLGANHHFFGKNLPDSIKNKMSDGRRKGQNNPASKISDYIATKIINDYINTNSTQEYLAKKYNITRSSVKRILSNNKWKHLKNYNIIKLIREKSDSRRIKTNKRKFNNYQILEIRSKFQNGYSWQEFSNEYGVSRGVIFNIIKYKTYKEI